MTKPIRFLSLPNLGIQLYHIGCSAKQGVLCITTYKSNIFLFYRFTI